MFSQTKTTGALLHGRQVQALVEGADVRRAVAEEADRDAIEALQAEAHGASGRDRDVGADDRVRHHRADGEVGQVHLAALAAGAAGRLPPDFGGDGVRATRPWRSDGRPADACCR